MANIYALLLAFVHGGKKISNQLINLDSVHTSVNYCWPMEDLVLWLLTGIGTYKCKSSLSYCYKYKMCKNQTYLWKYKYLTHGY